MSKQYSKFEYAQKKIQFLAELDERAVNQLDYWQKQRETQKENLEQMEENDYSREYYERELREADAAIDAINDIRAMLEKQI